MEFSLALLKEIPIFNLFLNFIILIIVGRVYIEVRKTNGRLIKLETWQVEHEKMDDERHDEVMRRLEKNENV